MDSKLNLLAEELEKLDESFVSGDTATHFIAVRKGGGGELIIEANKAGMLHLAHELVALAAGEILGAHYQIDEAGMADTAEQTVVFTFKEAEWD